jgi:hypothetical protein
LNHLQRLRLDESRINGIITHAQQHCQQLHDTEPCTAQRRLQDAVGGFLPYGHILAAAAVSRIRINAALLTTLLCAGPCVPTSILAAACRAAPVAAPLLSY